MMVPDNNKFRLLGNQNKNNVLIQNGVKDDGRSLNERKTSRQQHKGGRIPVYVGKNHNNTSHSVKKNGEGKTSARSLENLTQSKGGHLRNGTEMGLFREPSNLGSRKQSLSTNDVRGFDNENNDMMNNPMAIPTINGSRKKRKQWYQSKDLSQSVDDLSFPGATALDDNEASIFNGLNGIEGNHVKSKSCNDIMSEANRENQSNEKKSYSAGSTNNSSNKRKKLLVKSTKLTKERKDLIRDIYGTGNHNNESNYLFISPPHAEEPKQSGKETTRKSPQKETIPLTREQEIEMMLRRQPKQVRKEPLGMAAESDNEEKQIETRKVTNDFSNAGSEKLLQKGNRAHIERGVRSMGEFDQHSKNTNMGEREHSFVFNQKSISEESNAIINKILLKKRLREKRQESDYDGEHQNNTREEINDNHKHNNKASEIDENMNKRNSVSDSISYRNNKNNKNNNSNNNNNNNNNNKSNYSNDDENSRMDSLKYNSSMASRNKNNNMIFPPSVKERDLSENSLDDINYSFSSTSSHNGLQSLKDQYVTAQPQTKINGSRDAININEDSDAIQDSIATSESIDTSSLENNKSSALHKHRRKSTKNKSKTGNSIKNDPQTNSFKNNDPRKNDNRSKDQHAKNTRHNDQHTNNSRHNDQQGNNSRHNDLQGNDISINDDSAIDISYLTRNSNSSSSKNKKSINRNDVIDRNDIITNESFDSSLYNETKFEKEESIFSLDLDESSASLIAGGTSILEMSSGLVAKKVPSKYNFRISLDESQTASQSGHFIKNLLFNENNEWVGTPHRVPPTKDETNISSTSNSTKNENSKKDSIKTLDDSTKRNKVRFDADSLPTCSTEFRNEAALTSEEYLIEDDSLERVNSTKDSRKEKKPSKKKKNEQQTKEGGDKKVGAMSKGEIFKLLQQLTQQEQEVDVNQKTANIESIKQRVAELKLSSRQKDLETIYKQNLLFEECLDLKENLPGMERGSNEDLEDKEEGETGGQPVGRTFSKSRREEFLRKYKNPSELEEYLNLHSVSNNTEKNKLHSVSNNNEKNQQVINNDARPRIKQQQQQQHLKNSPKQQNTQRLHQPNESTQEFNINQYNRIYGGDRTPRQHHPPSHGLYLHPSGLMYDTPPAWRNVNQQEDYLLDPYAELDFPSLEERQRNASLLYSPYPPPSSLSSSSSTTNLQDSRRFKRSILPTSDLETLFEVDEKPPTVATPIIRSARRENENATKSMGVHLPQPPPPRKNKGRRKEDDKTDQVLKLLEQARNILNFKKMKSEIRQMRDGDYDDGIESTDSHDEGVGNTYSGIRRSTSFTANTRRNNDIGNYIDDEVKNLESDIRDRNKARLPKIPLSAGSSRYNSPPKHKSNLTRSHSASNVLDAKTRGSNRKEFWETGTSSEESTGVGAYKELYNDRLLSRNKLTNSLELINEATRSEKQKQINKLNPRLSKSCGALGRAYDGVNYSDDSGIETNNSISIDSNLDSRGLGTNFKRSMGTNVPSAPPSLGLTHRSDYSFQDPHEFQRVRGLRTNNMASKQDSNAMLQNSLNRTKQKTLYDLIQPQPPSTARLSGNKSILKTNPYISIHQSYNNSSKPYLSTFNSNNNKNSSTFNSNTRNTSALNSDCPLINPNLTQKTHSSQFNSNSHLNSEFNSKNSTYLQNDKESNRTAYENTIKQRQPFSSTPMNRYSLPQRLRERNELRGGWYRRNSSYTTYVNDYLQQQNSQRAHAPSSIEQNNNGMGGGYDYRLSNHLVMK